MRRRRRADDPVLPEPARSGVTPETCNICASDDAVYVWTDARWRLRRVDDCNAVPVYILEPRAHLDLGELTDELAAELGVLTVRVERAMASVPGIARVHVYRFGDGAQHLHLWFWGRPEGLLQLRGACLTLWEDAMPALPEELRAAIDTHVAARMQSPAGAISSME